MPGRVVEVGRKLRAAQDALEGCSLAQTGQPVVWSVPVDWCCKGACPRALDGACPCRTGNRRSALTRPAAIDLKSNFFTACETQRSSAGMIRGRASRMFGVNKAAEDVSVRGKLLHVG